MLLLLLHLLLPGGSLGVTFYDQIPLIPQGQCWVPIKIRRPTFCGTLIGPKALCPCPLALAAAHQQQGNSSSNNKSNDELDEMCREMVDRSNMDQMQYIQIALSQCQEQMKALHMSCNNSSNNGTFNPELAKLHRALEENNLNHLNQLANQDKEMKVQMAHCDERINALQSTCNSPALQIGTHRTEQDEQSQLDGKRNDAENETLAQSAAECTRIIDELQKLKSPKNANTDLPNGHRNGPCDCQPSEKNMESAGLTAEVVKIQRELENATQRADSELRANQEADKLIKNLQLQLANLQTKAAEQSQLLDDCADPPAAEWKFILFIGILGCISIGILGYLLGIKRRRSVHLRAAAARGRQQRRRKVGENLPMKVEIVSPSEISPYFPRTIPAAAAIDANIDDAPTAAAAAAIPASPFPPSSQSSGFSTPNGSLCQSARAGPIQFCLDSVYYDANEENLFGQNE